MNGHPDTKNHLQKIVARDLAEIQPQGLRSWIEERLIEPLQVSLAVDPNGDQIEEFWLVTDHQNSKSYRIAYSPLDDAFGIAVSLDTGVEWYMGDYGTFIEAVEAM